MSSDANMDVADEKKNNSTIERKFTFISVPDELLCPISHELFRDPVINAVGNTYDRESILEWLQNKATDPLTNAALSTTQLFPCLPKKQAIAAWREANGIITDEALARCINSMGIEALFKSNLFTGQLSRPLHAARHVPGVLAGEPHYQHVLTPIEMVAFRDGGVSTEDFTMLLSYVDTTELMASLLAWNVRSGSVQKVRVILQNNIGKLTTLRGALLEAVRDVKQNEDLLRLLLSEKCVSQEDIADAIAAIVTNDSERDLRLMVSMIPPERNIELKTLRRSGSNNTLLFSAQSLHMMRLLINEFGLDPMKTHEISGLPYICYVERKEMYLYLIRHHPLPDGPGRDFYLDSFIPMRCVIDTLQTCIPDAVADGCNLYGTDRFGATIMEIAFKTYDLPLVEAVLAAGFDVRRHVGSRTTVMHKLAVWNAQDEKLAEPIIKRLCEACGPRAPIDGNGEDPTQLDNATALFLRIRRKYMDTFILSRDKQLEQVQQLINTHLPEFKDALAKVSKLETTMTKLSADYEVLMKAILKMAPLLPAQAMSELRALGLPIPEPQAAVGKKRKFQNP